MSHHLWSPVLLLIVLTVGLAGAPGCRGPQSGGLTIAGSTSVQPLAELLADRYMAEHAGETINVQGGGSSAGVRAAQSGAAAIGMASRELKPSETGLKWFVMARDAIAIIVNPGNPVQALSKEQVRDIYSRRIRDWGQVGKHSGTINFITREEGSGTRGAFEEMVMGEEAEISPDGIVQDSTGAVRTIVAGDRHAIGYISLGMVTPEVCVVELDGIKPTHDTVVAGQYSLTRPFLLLTKGEPTPQAKAYIDYVFTPGCQAIVEEEGYVPAEVTPRP